MFTECKVSGGFKIRPCPQPAGWSTCSAFPYGGGGGGAGHRLWTASPSGPCEGGKGAGGRRLTSSNLTIPFILPPLLALLALAATIPQSPGEGHQTRHQNVMTRHQNVPSTLGELGGGGGGKNGLSPGRFLPR